MTEFETLKEYEKDGWTIQVAIAPDYDYRPGEDDDIYPVLEAAPSYWDEDERERDYDGRYLPQPITVRTRSGPAIVSVEQIEKRAEQWGSSKRRTRELLRRDAEAIGLEELSWVVVRVTASRGTISGTDYLGAVEYDLRERNPDKYALETVEHYAMAENAIHEAAERVAGQYATQALSY